MHALCASNLKRESSFSLMFSCLPVSGADASNMRISRATHCRHSQVFVRVINTTTSNEERHAGVENKISKRVTCVRTRCQEQKSGGAELVRKCCNEDQLRRAAVTGAGLTIPAKVHLSPR